jgi:excisionase family DNA binding protein
MRHASAIENLDDIGAAAPGRSCLTIAEAARRLGISRSTVYRDIRQGKVNAVAPQNGVRVIEESELQRAYSNGAGKKAAPTLKISSAVEGRRLAQLEADLLSSNAQVKILETQLAASEEKEAEHRREIDGLRTHQATNLPDADAAQPKKSDSKYYSRRRRRKIEKLIDRSLMFIGIASLVIAASGILIGIIYTLDHSSR